VKHRLFEEAFDNSS